MKKLLTFVSAFVFVLAACDKQVEQTPGVSLGSTPATRVPHWLELPEISHDDGLDFFSHNGALNGKPVRNWSFYWDYDNRLSAWVAYLLYRSISAGASSSEAWGYDPHLPASRQQNVSGGYKDGNNGWYVRGQLLPYADRADYELNKTTFYSTNIVPIDNDLNGRIRDNLERRIRSWANASDTCYVVSGCITQGARYYVFDRSNQKVTVPTAFFKAVLRYSRDTAVGTDGYCAIAFLVDHEPIPSVLDCKNLSMSVKSLEDQLGYQLFVNLDEVLGKEKATAVKTENPRDNSWWWE